MIKVKKRILLPIIKMELFVCEAFQFYYNRSLK